MAWTIAQKNNYFIPFNSSIIDYFCNDLFYELYKGKLIESSFYELG